MPQAVTSAACQDGKCAECEDMECEHTCHDTEPVW